MKIEINNQQYLLIKKHDTNNWLIVEKYDNNDNLINRRGVTESEFIDLYNILIYANDNNKNIHELWEQNSYGKI